MSRLQGTLLLPPFGGMPPHKRPRGDAATLRELGALCGGSRAGLARVLRTLGDRGYLANAERLLGPGPARARSARQQEVALEGALGDAVLDLVGAPTPTGPLVVLREGIHLVRLQSLLHVLCAQSDAFARLLRDTLGRAPGGVVGLVVYADEIKPGNPLRPNPGRCSWAVYAQMADVPEWARSCTMAALPLAAVRPQELKALGGPLGA